MPIFKFINIQEQWCKRREQRKLNHFRHLHLHHLRHYHRDFCYSQNCCFYWYYFLSRRFLAEKCLFSRPSVSVETLALRECTSPCLFQPCLKLGVWTRVLFNWVCKTILNQILFYLLSFWFWMAVWILALFWLLTSVNSQLRFVLKMISVTKGAKFQIANQNHNDSN